MVEAVTGVGVGATTLMVGALSGVGVGVGVTMAVRLVMG